MYGKALFSRIGSGMKLAVIDRLNTEKRSNRRVQSYDHNDINNQKPKVSTFGFFSFRTWLSKKFDWSIWLC
ncbi:hypothetical protein VCR8J2_840112 [Vibrio coralliirubri]|nr:hypothetical protein VCR8J2_840112 [Vibrio coralliirubri]